MIATITLCILSSLAFCVGTRGLIALSFGAKRLRPLALRGPKAFSAGAWRLARGYATFALALLTLVAFAGAVHSYWELFSSAL